MQLVYNSDSYVVVQFDVPGSGGAGDGGAAGGPARGGYEIVDKFARKEIFIQGALAERFQQGVRALVEEAPGGASAEALDDFIAGYIEWAQTPVVLH